MNFYQSFLQRLSILFNNPWGEPGDQSPWSGRRGGGGRKGGGGSGGGDGPNFDDIFRLPGNFKNPFPGGADAKKIWIMAAFAVLALWLLSGVYSIAGGEQGVVLRFGKFHRVTPPGLHMHLPWPFETVLKPNTGIVNQIDVGASLNYGTRASTIDDTPSAQMLTQDKNILNMHYRILWRIDDPAKFLFNLRDPYGTIRAASESVMREQVGQRTFDGIIRGGREEMGQKAKEHLQQILDGYESGVLIVDVLPQKIDPPAEVIDAFNDVQRAEQDAEKEINQAEAYRSDIVPRARGDAQRIQLEAQAYKERSITEAEGEAQRFISVLNAYREASSVTEKRIYLETMQEIVRNSAKVVVDSKGAGNVLPFLPLQDIMRRNGQTQPATN